VTRKLLAEFLGSMPTPAPSSVPLFGATQLAGAAVAVFVVRTLYPARTSWRDGTRFSRPTAS
jgi:hypothetical protein